MGAEQTIHDLSPGSRAGLPDMGGMEEPAPNASEKQKSLDFGSLLRVARRNVLLIAAITMGTSALAAAVSLGPPGYEGSFQVLVEPITSQGRSSDPSAISRDRAPEGDTIDYSTLLQVLQSPQVLSKIAKDIQTRYRDVSAESLQQDLANQVLTVQRPRNVMTEKSKVIEVVYQGSDPERVQFILERLKEGYLRYSLEDRKTRIGGGVQFIEDQLPSLQQRVNTLEAEMQALKQRYRITDPEAEGTSLSNLLQETRSARLQAQRELAEQQTLYLTLQRQIGLTPSEAMAAASLSENPTYKELLLQLKKVETQIAIKEARFREESPVIKALRDQQRELTQLLESEAQRNLGQASLAANPQVRAFQDPTRLDLIKQFVTAANNGQVLQVRTQAIAQAESFLDQRQQQFPLIVRQYNDLKQRLDIATRTLNQFLTQRETLRIEAAQKEVPWELLYPPSLVRDANGVPVPIPTKATRTLAMGFLGGLVIGLASAMWREKRKDVFFCTEDIAGGVPLTMLGVLPYKEGASRVMNAPNTLIDPFAKAINSLYTNIRFFASNPPIRSLVIGSPTSGDGKTTAALNLAVAAATMGQRVLLVDANMRSPQMHHLTNVSNVVGLSELLRDKLSPAEAIQRSPLEKNLSVLPAGQALAEASRLIASADMQDLAQELATRFDLVIYDTPNLVEFADANFLTACTDGMVMIVGVGRTKCSAISQVISDFRRFHLTVLGMIVNHTGKKVTTAYNPDSPYAQGYEETPAILENLRILKPGVSPSTKP